MVFDEGSDSAVTYWPLELAAATATATPLERSATLFGTERPNNVPLAKGQFNLMPALRLQSAANRDKPFHQPATLFHRLGPPNVVLVAQKDAAYRSVPIVIAGDTCTVTAGHGSYSGVTPVGSEGEGW